MRVLSGSVLMGHGKTQCFAILSNGKILILEEKEAGVFFLFYVYGADTNI